MKKRTPYFVLLFFCVPLFFLNVFDIHPWGDDYAGYIKEAQNIATGKPYYQSNYVFNELNTDYAPPQYSPGFPILLAPVVKVWGLAIRPMLYLISFFLSALLFAFYFYFRKYCSVTVAICIAIIGVYSSAIIDLKQEVLSDIPATLFVTLYFVLRQSTPLSITRKLWLMVIGTFAILIRTQAIFLPFAELILLSVWLFKKINKDEKVLLKDVARQPGFYLGLSILILFLLVNGLLFSAPQSGLTFYIRLYIYEVHGVWQLIGNNVNYLSDLLLSLFKHTTTDPFYQAPANIIAFAGLVFGLLGCWMFIKKGLRVDDIFFLLTCLMILITPVYQGFRYFAPAMAVFLLYTKTGLATLPKALNLKPAWMAIVFTTIYLLLGFSDYEHALQPPKDLSWTAYKPQDLSAFAYLEKNVPDKDIIIFAKPRALTLYTNKRAMTLAWQVPTNVIKRKVDSLGVVKYLLWGDGVSEEYARQYMYKTKSCLDSVIINDKYKLYRLK